MDSTGIVKDFFSASDADVAIISVAKMNRYNAPSEKTLTILTSLNTLIYETGDSGAIMV